MVHLATSVPWWLELSAAAFIVRLALLPFLIAQVKNAAILEMLAPHIQRLNIAIDSAKKQNRVAEALFHTEGLNTLYKGHNVSILRNFQLALLNIPLLFAFSNAIRVLVSYPQTLQDVRF
jgi:membrane protein insertase Oxa1/YidC/SpoIIIJ